MSKNRLKTYQSRRNFSASSEPKGRVSSKNNPPIFVIHKHDARSLHYDLRLENKGVLLSWAVPKGPPERLNDKRLAIHVEDHPLEYANFEGVIPEGNYGAGGVMIWDKGTFKNLKSKPLDECLKKGIIEVELDGKKLHGRYALIRTHFSENSWLLIKEKSGGPTYDSIFKEDQSVVSGKTMEEVEGDHDSIWESKRKKAKSTSPLYDLLGISETSSSPKKKKARPLSKKTIAKKPARKAEQTATSKKKSIPTKATKRKITTVKAERSPNKKKSVQTKVAKRKSTKTKGIA